MQRLTMGQTRLERKQKEHAEATQEPHSESEVIKQIDLKITPPVSKFERTGAPEATERLWSDAKP